MLVAQGNLPEALKSFRDGLAISDRLAQADPGNAGWQRDLSVSYDRVGDVLVAQGNLPEALKSFRDGLAIRDRLAQADPGNAGWQRDLSVSYEQDRRRAGGAGQSARGAEILSATRLAIADRLAKADPGNAGWQRDLSVSYEQGRRRAGGAGQSARGAEVLPRRARHQGPAGRGRPRQRRLAARSVGVATIGSATCWWRRAICPRR